MYSMRNLSRPSLTQYELDSKSLCMAASLRAQASHGDWEWGLERPDHS